MKLSSEKVLDMIEAMLKNEYTPKKLATDYSGCYDKITLPDGSTGYVSLEDIGRSGITPPVRRGVVEVCGLKIFYADAGYFDYLPDFFIVNEDPADHEFCGIPSGKCNIEIEEEKTSSSPMS